MLNSKAASSLGRYLYSLFLPLLHAICAPALLASLPVGAQNAASEQPRFREVPIRHWNSGAGYPNAGNFTPSVIDADSDGLPELVGAVNRRGNLHFIAPDRKGLASVFPADLGSVPQRANRDVRAADLNGDGRPDLLFNTYTHTGVAAQLRLFLSEDSGNYREVSSFVRDKFGAPVSETRLRGRGETIVIADFNGDGLLDAYIPYYTFEFYVQNQCPVGDATCDPIPTACRNDPYCDATTVPVECPESTWTECGPNATRSLLLLNAGNGTLGMGPQDPVFIEATVEAGTDHQANVGLERRYPGGTGSRDPCGHQPEGAQAIDYDADGRLDLFVGGHLFRNTGTQAVATAAGTIAVPQFRDVTLELGLYDQVDLLATVSIPVLRASCASTGACDPQACPTAGPGIAPDPADVCAVRSGTVRDAMIAEGLLRSDGVTLNCVLAGGASAREYRKYFVDGAEFTPSASILRFRLFEEGAKWFDWNNDGCLDLAIIKTWSSERATALRIGAPTAYEPLDRTDRPAGSDGQASKDAGVRLFECQPDASGAPRFFRERLLAGRVEPETNIGGAMFQVDATQSQQMHFLTQPAFGFNIADIDNDGREDIITMRGHVFQNLGDRFRSVGASTWGYDSQYEGIFAPTGRGGPGFIDADRDGRVDFVYPTRSVASVAVSGHFPDADQMMLWENLTPSMSVRPLQVEVLDSANRRNQQGHLIRVTPPSGRAAFARLVDGGSAFLSQTEYVVPVNSGEQGVHAIDVVYASGTVRCFASSGQLLRVRPSGQTCSTLLGPTPASVGVRARNTGAFRPSGNDGLIVEDVSDSTVVVWRSLGTRFAGDWGNTPAPGLHAVGVADLDGDGKADVVLEDVNDAAVHVWRSTGTGFAGAWGSQLPGGYRFAALGDFDGDGRSDVVIEQPGTRQLHMWSVTGSSGAERFAWVAYVQLPQDFRLAAVGEFDGDGVADLLIEDARDGGLHVWLNQFLSTRRVAFAGSFGVIPSADMRFAAAGDFDGDGRADLVMENLSNRAVVVWRTLPSNAGFVELPGLARTLEPESHVAGSGHFDGDGHADLLIESRLDHSISMWRTALQGSGYAFDASSAPQLPPAGYRLLRP